MKLIEGDKLIATPVVFYIERLPLLALPYYIIPLKKGRHSGILPFTFGKFERGDRWVKNVGYYWAASDYLDWLGSVDYYDIRRTFTLNSRLNFVKRYVLDGFVSTAYTKESVMNKRMKSAVLFMGIAVFMVSAARAEIRSEVVNYQIAGQPFQGYLSYDDSISGKRPGILVVHEWWGHNAYARKRADMLAKLGYTAFALDM